MMSLLKLINEAHVPPAYFILEANGKQVTTT
jgi:hypothetical protein